MAAINPYQPPSAPIDTASQAARCPKCGAQSATQVRFTWWGGALAPRLFHVVKCQQCRAQYNGKTGATLGKVIAIYHGVSLVVTLAVGYWFFLARR